MTANAIIEAHVNKLLDKYLEVQEQRCVCSDDCFCPECPECYTASRLEDREDSYDARNDDDPHEGNRE
jgi:hypothetical protein